MSANDVDFVAENDESTNHVLQSTVRRVDRCPAHTRLMPLLLQILCLLVLSGMAAHGHMVTVDVVLPTVADTSLPTVLGPGEVGMATEPVEVATVISVPAHEQYGTAETSSVFDDGHNLGADAIHVDCTNGGETIHGRVTSAEVNSGVCGGREGVTATERVQETGMVPDPRELQHRPVKASDVTDHGQHDGASAMNGDRTDGMAATEHTSASGETIHGRATSSDESSVDFATSGEGVGAPEHVQAEGVGPDSEQDLEHGPVEATDVTDHGQHDGASAMNGGVGGGGEGATATGRVQATNMAPAPEHEPDVEASTAVCILT